MIYARKGERVTCTEGHHIATFRRDVFVNDIITADMLEWAVGISPRQDGDRLGACDICGGYWNASDLKESPTGKLHFADGWR